jgi:hypothetical protein
MGRVPDLWGPGAWFAAIGGNFPHHATGQADVEDLTPAVRPLLAFRIGSERVRSLLDEVMPEYDVHEVHELWVPAKPEPAYEAVKAVTAKEVRLFGPFMSLRAVPARLQRKPRSLDAHAPMLTRMLEAGFVDLGAEPGSEVVLGAVGRFWSPTGNLPLRTVRTREDFKVFAEPGYSKAAMNFSVEPQRDGSLLRTETRVVGTDAEATRKFRRYWWLIGWASAAIRRSWLKAIRRRLSRSPA